MKAFIRYYKWHIVFALLVITCIGFMLVNMASQVDSDLIIGYVGTNYVNVQNFNDRKSEIELLLKDTTGDDKRVANMVAYTADLQSDIDEHLQEMVDDDSYDIYIASKDTFAAFPDKSAFVDAEAYVNFGENAPDTLKDSSGRVYATSLAENEFIRDLGVVDTTGLYIAVAMDKDGEEISDKRKNARNIAGYIIDRR